MGQTNKQAVKVLLDRSATGYVQVLALSKRHFSERSVAAIRLAIVEQFSALKQQLAATDVVFHFDRIVPERRAIVASVPAAELPLFRAFLQTHNIGLLQLRRSTTPLPANRARRPLAPLQATAHLVAYE